MVNRGQNKVDQEYGHNTVITVKTKSRTWLLHGKPRSKESQNMVNRDQNRVKNMIITR